MLARRGIELVALEGAGCCGALPHHMGREDESRAWAKKRDHAYEQGQYDGVLITATGCSAQLKDYAHLFAGDPVWEPRAARFAAAARDFAELCTPMTVTPPQALRVAYHPACSLQNSLKLNGVGEALLEAAGFIVTPFAESASVLRLGGQLFHPAARTFRPVARPQAGQYRRRRARRAGQRQYRLPAASGGGRRAQPPILHIAELLDWAEGGPKPSEPIWNCPGSRIKVAPCAARLSFPCCFCPARPMP